MLLKSVKDILRGNQSIIVGLALGLAIAAWSMRVDAWNPMVLGGRCQQSGQTCYGTIGNAGGGGACCDPQSRTIADCDKNNKCQGGRPYIWHDSDLPLRWWFNPNGMPGQSGYQSMTAQQIEAAFKEGWDSWSSITCTSFTHNYRGQTTNRMSVQDKQVVMYLPTPAEWAQMGVGSSTLAFARPVPDNNGRLLDADIAFNPMPSNQGWKIGKNTGQWELDLIHVAAHEIGHAIGFAHTSFSSSLMYYAARPGPFPGMSRDELDAACHTYKRKGPCTQDSDCGGCLQCTNSACVPKNIQLSRNICGPCTKPDDCGGAQDICILTEQGNRCAQACDSAGCCPDGYRCAEISFAQKMCVPDSGLCPDVRCTNDAACGPGEQCSGGVCKPQPVSKDPTTCKSCTSDANCGGNGNLCVPFEDGQRRCVQPCVGGNFCPNTFNCRPTSRGRLCMPPDDFCPCTSVNDCIQDEVCRLGVCRPAQCGFGCSCKEDSHCDPGHKCYETQGGGICLKPCGSSASYPDGSPGGPCRANGTCDLGAQCYQMGSNITICLKPCTNDSSCNTGGKCYRMGSQAFCLCQSASECLSGQACNQSVLGQYGGGACASAGSASQCDAGYTCREITEGLTVCYPQAVGVGQKCGSSAPCVDGASCILTSQGSNEGTCFENCTQTNQCKHGGSCVLTTGDGSKFCGCFNSSNCAAGQICDLILQGGGICKASSAPYCGNGVCDAAQNENCSNCPKDCPCPSGQVCSNGTCVSQTQKCGNGTCERELGEDCGTCPKDCPCDAGRVCKDNRCVVNENCGNGTCERELGEDCGTCLKDCPCDASRICKENRCIADPCGNGTCERELGEDCGTCPKDCPCDVGKICQNNRCVVSQHCGNGTCEREHAEDCGTCPRDCPCETGKICKDNRCVVSGQTDPNSTDGGNEDGDISRPGPGCGCNANSGLPNLSLLFLLLGLLWFSTRSRKYRV